MLETMIGKNLMSTAERTGLPFADGKGREKCKTGQDGARWA